MLRYALLTLLVLAFPAAAQTAVDGDTIKLNGTTYRLSGIDAAEAAGMKWVFVPRTLR